MVQAHPEMDRGSGFRGYGISPFYNDSSSVGVLFVNRADDKDGLRQMLGGVVVGYRMCDRFDVTAT